MQTVFAANQQNLPTLGDHTSGIISLAQERALGQRFLRSLRARAPLKHDPVLQEYLELLTYKLASHSQLKDRRLDLSIINNKTINAFAAPGGIIGVNLGLFLFGETEAEISAILSHELAHLSQRHFARRSEAGRKASLASMAGLLAGVILIATAGTDAGLAAISASTGISQSEMLRYSRGREAEADRVGIDTLIEAGLNPRAMAHMFERLNRASRFSGTNIPEFLLTHPVTKNRIADSYAQAEQKNIGIETTRYSSLDFQLMRARVQVITTKNPLDAVKHMQDTALETQPLVKIAARYGLALALIETKQFEKARQIIISLKQDHPSKIAFIAAEANLQLKAGNHLKAINLLEASLNITPANYPLSMIYAEALMQYGRAEQATIILQQISQLRPNDQEVWYLLAEAFGLAQDIVGVHQARAEYFVRVGNFKQALKQLKFATPMILDNFQQNARIQQRISEIRHLIAEAKS
ncbi:MAG: M48 family metalloprotease [Pseudomonadales bacterium]|nr:M48 family metalloprotease [Pseudomonadales bacterium]